MTNPYWDNDFFQFFQTLLTRLFSWSGPLAYDELQLIVLSLVALSCGLLGPLLVLKRMSMLANSLSHTILLGLAVSFLIAEPFHLPSLFIGAMAAAFLTSFCTYLFSKVLRLQEDASVGVVFTSLFSLGIVLVSLYMRDVHLGIEAVMGSCDTLDPEDVRMAFAMAVANGAMIALCFWPMQIAAFDRGFASSMGMRPGLQQGLLLFLTAATCIAAFRAVGVLIVLSFLIGPPLIARMFTHRLSTLLLASPLIGIAASLIGVALSRHLLTVSGLALSTGGIISCTLALAYAMAALIRFKLAPLAISRRNQ